MRPTVGRIVHYFIGPSFEPNAAIVIDMAPEGRVTLRVFARHGAMLLIPNVAQSEGPKEGHWCWPPREQ